MAPYEFVAGGRNRRTAIGLVAAWCLLLAAWLVLDAALWILALLALTTVPAMRDLWLDPAAGMALDSARLSWRSGRRQAEIALADIEKVRIDRSWDFAVRVAIVLHTGRKIRMPAESTPPHEVLERELTARGIAVERRPFSLF